MPTKTFINLPDDKKETLLKAARREFSQHPFLSSSINQIIIDAKIPRGSFYQYFDNKEDLYFYVLEQDKEKLINGLLPKLENKKLSDFFLTTFDYMIEYFNISSSEEYYKNVFISLHQFESLHPMNFHIFNGTLKEKGLKLLNADPNIQDELYEMLLALLFKNIIFVLEKKKSREEVYNKYQKLLHIIEKGLEKGGEKWELYLNI